MPRTRPLGRPALRLLLPLLVCLPLVTALPDRLAGAAAPGPRGFSAARTDDLYSAERRLLSAVDPVTARELFDRIVSSPRIAGTPGAAAVADWLEGRLQTWGLEVERHAYRVYLPHAREATVERLSPTRAVLSLAEAGAADHDPSAYPAAAGYSAAGDVVAPVVYANYGRAEDFAALERSGIGVAGRVALVRYGRAFRGQKVANAVAAGAAAVLLYSDPADDGASLGDVYPRGPFRPPDGIQRGTVKGDPPGDPSTPGWPSTADAPRRDPSAPGSGVLPVPVVALGYDAAARLLEPLQGPAAPADWRGGLPLDYRLGDGHSVRVRVRVTLDDRPYKTITNVVATLPGTGSSGQQVLAGAHYDSWTAGAVDNASGTVSLLLTARALARLRQVGIRPARTIRLAFWDGEEWGLLGSTEYVEEHAEELTRSAVAYLNQDGVAGGPSFGLAASPSLAGLLMDVAHAVPDPLVPTASVRDEWLRRARAGGAVRPTLAPPGGGSDQTAFFAHLGVPAASHGFQGPSGVYHSTHDDRRFMRRFGDADFAQHVASAAITTLALWRLASADMPPLDYGAYARVVRSRARELLRRDLAPDAGLERLVRATDAFAAAAGRLEVDAAVVLAATGPPPSFGLGVASRRLLHVERRFTRPAGLPGRTWYRNVVFAPDPEDSYAVQIFPGLVDALRVGDAEAARAEVDDLVGRMHAATDELRAAAAALGGAQAIRSAGR